MNVPEIIFRDKISEMSSHLREKLQFSCKNVFLLSMCRHKDGVSSQLLYALAQLMCPSLASPAPADFEQKLIMEEREVAFNKSENVELFREKTKHRYFSFISHD